MTKYIVVTGGVVSSLGKGVTAASLGFLFKARGYKVEILKFDPYLNVDPGTMSPYQHGEVFVTEDGAETDLDLGHYERFLDQNCHRQNNVTAGQIYEQVISRERSGQYLGKTVQIVPHITDEIKRRIRRLSADLVIVEVGGTVGDIEGLAFLEAIRQFRLEVGRQNIAFVHVTLVPYLSVIGEHKTKPTQHSVMKLREIGIEPDLIICRTAEPLSDELRAKIALFTNVEKERVISEWNIRRFIYEVPEILHSQQADDILLKILGLKNNPPKLRDWHQLLKNAERLKEKVTIGIAGKYVQVKDSYKSILEALRHAAIANQVLLEVRYIDVESKNLIQECSGIGGIIVPGGFGERGVEGKIAIAGYARRKNIPFLGICLGMQCAVISFAREVAGMPAANSKEFNPKTPFPVIDYLPEQFQRRGTGASMRLGLYGCRLKPNTLARKIYGRALTYERHRHRLELNNRFRSRLEKHGLVISGMNPPTHLAEIIELPANEFYLGVQFHPEFLSRPLRPHPLFSGLIQAAKKYGPKG